MHSIRLDSLSHHQSSFIHGLFKIMGHQSLLVSKSFAISIIVQAVYPSHVLGVLITYIEARPEVAQRHIPFSRAKYLLRRYRRSFLTVN